MDFKDFFAAPDDDDRRLDRIIRKFSSGLSLSEIYKAIRKGLIKLNGSRARQDSRVKAGDKISIASFLLDYSDAENDKNIAPVQPETVIQKQNLLPPIVFRNENIIIFNKPRNLSVQRSYISKQNGKISMEISLEEIVTDLYRKEASGRTSLSFNPGPLHRIDRFTTGLIAFSWSLKGARWFTENIKNHAIQKKYLGIVQGTLRKSHEWIDYISDEENINGKSFHTVNVSSSASTKEKQASTIVKPVCYGKNESSELTLCEFFIKTGRHHQIRAQSAAHGFPLYGDTAYGGKKSQNGFFLHAFMLIIPENPVGLPHIIKAPPPDDFRHFFSQFFIKTCDMTDFDL